MTPDVYEPQEVLSALRTSLGTPQDVDVALLIERLAANSTPNKIALKLYADTPQREELGQAWVYRDEWFPGARGTRFSHYFHTLKAALDGAERGGREGILRLQLLRAVVAPTGAREQLVLLKYIIAPEYALTGTLLEHVYGCPLSVFYSEFVGVAFDPRKAPSSPEWTRGNAIHAGYRAAADTYVRSRDREQATAAYLDAVRESWLADFASLLMDRPKTGPKKLHTVPIESAASVVARCVERWADDETIELLQERMVYASKRGLSGRLDRFERRRGPAGPVIHLTEIKTGGSFGSERDPVTGIHHAGGMQALAYRELIASDLEADAGMQTWIEELDSEQTIALDAHPVVTRGTAGRQRQEIDILAQSRNVGYVAGSGLLTGYDRQHLDGLGRRGRHIGALGGDWNLYASHAPCQLCAARAHGICAVAKPESPFQIDNLFSYAPEELFSYWAWFHRQLQDEARRSREWLYHLATSPVHQLERMEGVTISGLTVAGVAGRSVTLQRETPIETRMREDDRVLLSLATMRPGDARSVEGRILRVSEHRVELRLRDVIPDTRATYRIDDLSQHGMPGWQVEGLTDFLVTSMAEAAVRGRRLHASELPAIAQFVLGTGAPPLPLGECAPDRPLAGMNELQQRAIAAALALEPGDSPVLIQGPPGTGKTSMIAELIHAIATDEFATDEPGADVRPLLILANSHQAVDEVVLKLIQRFPELAPYIVRVGRVRAGMDDTVRACVLGERLRAPLVLEEAEMASEGATRLVRLISEGNLLHDQAMIFAGTLAGARAAELRGLSFRTVIVDECGQATEPATLQALRHMLPRYRSRLILVGDHKQLPPVVPESDGADASAFIYPPSLAGAGIGEGDTLRRSMFERLAARYPQRLITLRQQYRMNAEICALVSDTFYDGVLQPGTAEVAGRRLAGTLARCGVKPGTGGLLGQGWPVMLVDTSRDPDARDSASGPRPDESRQNGREAELVAGLVADLLAATPAERRAALIDEIGIVSAYRKQNNAIRNAVLARGIAPALVDRLRVDTVDRFQGGERDIMIVSLTNSNPGSLIGPLHADWRRMNVAISRARRSLVIVGDRRTFTHASVPAEEEAKDRYRRLFAGIDALVEADVARIVFSEAFGS